MLRALSEADGLQHWWTLWGHRLCPFSTRCPSILPEATIYSGHDMEKNLLPSPFSKLIWRSWVQNPWPPIFFGTKFNCLHEEMIPMLMLTSLSHLLPIQLAQCYLDPSFLLFLNLKQVVCATLSVTYRLSYLSVSILNSQVQCVYFPSSRVLFVY